MPFIVDLPKREKSKLASLWDHFQELQALTQREGPLVPVRYGADLMGISRQRVDELIKDGRLRVHRVNDHRMLYCSDIVEYAKAERKSGRPSIPAETMTVRDAFRVASAHKKS